MRLAQCASVAFVLFAAINQAPAQSIIYGTPQQLLNYYAEMNAYYGINVSGQTFPDFALISGNAGTVQSSVGTAWLAPQGNNCILTSVGDFSVVALPAGYSIGLSLDPVMCGTTRTLINMARLSLVLNLTEEVGVISLTRQLT